MDRRFTLDDPASLASLGIRFRVALDDVDVLHDDLVAVDPNNLTLLAFVGAGDNDHLVTLANTVHMLFLVRLRALRARARRSS